MKNLFTGIEVTFKEEQFDNSKYNSHFDRDGWRQHMIPAIESCVERVEREFAGFVKVDGLKWEREFTKRANGVITMYLSGKISVWTKDFCKNSDLFLSARLGSMKVDASFRPSKAA